MDNNGPLSKPKNTNSSLLSPSPLERIEQQRTSKELHIFMPSLGDIWIPIEIGIKACCV
jgi:hypothetical protein